MVNPGAFHGSRKSFLKSAVSDYFKAVQEGVGPEFLQTTIRRYLKRYPVDLSDDVEPSDAQLASVNDDEASEDVYPPEKEPDETEETFKERERAFEEYKKETKAKIDQITRWFKYRYNKQHEGAMKGEPHPLDILLANLAGVTLTKPGRMRTAYNVWGKENQELIDELIAERQEGKAKDGSDGEESYSGEAEGSKARKGKGKSKKTGKRFVKNGEEAFLAVRQEITMAKFAKLSNEVQQEWKAKAEEEHKTRLENWKAVQRAEFSTLPEDRQRCIDRLVKFMQPILDGVSKATGWPCAFIAGGPEPADAGQLNILSIHSGTTSGPIPMTFGTACRPAFKKYWIPVFTAFLQMCFSMEESKARSLVSTEMTSLHTQLAQLSGDTNATVNGVDLPASDGVMKDVQDMITTGTTSGGKAKGKAKEVEDKKKKPERKQEKRSDSERSQRIAMLRQTAGQSQKSASPMATVTGDSNSQRAPSNTTTTRAKAALARPKAGVSSSNTAMPAVTPNTSVAPPHPPATVSNTSTTDFGHHTPPPSPSSSAPLLRTAVSSRNPSPHCSPPPETPVSPPHRMSPPLRIPPESSSRLCSPPPPPLSPTRVLSPMPSFRTLTPLPASSQPLLSSSQPSSSRAVSLPTMAKGLCPLPPSPPPTSVNNSHYSSASSASMSGKLRNNAATRSGATNTDLSSSMSSKRKGSGTGMHSPGRKKRRRMQSPEISSIEAKPDKDGVESEDGVDELDEDVGEQEELVVPDDAPAYIWKVVQMSELLNLGCDMRRLVAAWMKLEKSAGFKGSMNLTASLRQPQIAEWIQHGRRPNFKPKIPDLEVYSDRFTAWFKKCCPSWRTKAEGTITMSRELDMDWSEMKLTGQNGITSIIAAMAFWQWALDAVPRNTPHHKQVFERLQTQFQEALEEVSYCISQISGAKDP
ncbi:SERTA domain-containing protein 3 [Marasmius crinis-equi]|uniref:SERTA domain-containing protein 3 n=1 Tax=Marasmius crinis-equi TaxID=585013 RepID=A0ABR3EPZ0_9AGAR